MYQPPTNPSREFANGPFAKSIEYQPLLHYWLKMASATFGCLGLMFLVCLFNPKKHYLTRFLLAFTSACTMAVFWEIGEFALDLFTGSHIQHDVSETLYDLVFGVSGAMASLVLIVLVSIFQGRREGVNESGGQSLRRNSVQSATR